MGASASPLPAAVDVVPGEQAGCEIRVRNDGQVVDEFTFEVLGDAAPWAQVVPSSLQLLPATLGTVQLQISPPRRPSTKEGALALGLKIVSKEDPEHPTTIQGVLNVAAYTQVTAQLVPQTSHAWRWAEHRLTVSNQGNHHFVTALTAGDPDDVLAFDVVPQSLEIDAGQAATATVRATARNLLIKRAAQPRPFRVTAATDGAQPIDAQGTLMQRGLLALSALAYLAAWIRGRDPDGPSAAGSGSAPGALPEAGPLETPPPR